MSDSKSYLEDLGGSKPESFNEEVFIKAPFNFKPLIFLSIVVLLIIGIFFTVHMMNRIEVPDYSEWTLLEMQQWVEQNKLSPVFKSHYTLDQNNGDLMEVTLVAGDYITKKDNFIVNYSLGPDPSEKITLIDFKGKTIEEVTAFIEANKATSVTIKKEINTLIEKGIVINYDFKDGSFDNYLRKNRMTIYVSDGPEEVDDTYKMPDLTSMTKAQVIAWATKEAINVEYDFQFNENAAYDQIYMQNFDKDTKITRTETIKVSVSKGKAITVPDFLGMTSSQASSLATYHTINVLTKYETSTSDPDTVIKQDISAGETIDTKTLVTLTLAKESNSHEILDFTGLTRDEAVQLASLKNITLFIRNIDSTEALDHVIEQDIEPGKWAKKDSILTLYVSNGLITTPDFVGMTKESATIEAERLGLTLIFKEIKSHVNQNNVIKAQSYEPGTSISSTDKIVCDVIKNSGVYGKDLSNMTVNEVTLWANANSIPLNVVDFYNNDYPSGKVYAQSVINRWIDTNEILTIHYSLGKVTVLDYIGRTKVEVANWINEVNQKGADIKAVYTLTTSSKEKRGIITEQSIISDYINTGSTIVFTVSATNNGISIPSLAGMSESDLSSWASENEVPYTINDKYSDTYAIGTIFGQNYTNRSLPDGGVLTVYRSIGKVHIQDFTGQNKTSIETWRSSINTDGAQISLQYKTASSDTVAKDAIISQTHIDEDVLIGTTIEVTLSSGPATP